MEAPENDRKRPPDGFLGRRREADVTPDTVLPRAQQDVALRTKDALECVSWQRCLDLHCLPAGQTSAWHRGSLPLPCPSGSCLAALVFLSRLVISLSPESASARM